MSSTPVTPKRRLRPVVMTMTLAAAWVILCLALEHFAGIYEPSEVTGRKGNLFGFLGASILICWAVAANGTGAPRTLGSRFLRGFSVAFSAALALGVGKYLYFSLVWGDFSGKMGEFTRRTLQARGASAGYINSFSALVEKSWQTPRVAVGSFLGLLLWGGIVAFVLAAAVTGISRIRSVGQREAS